MTENTDLRINPNFRFRSVFEDCPLPTILDIGAGDSAANEIGLSPLEKLASDGDAYVIGFDGAGDNLANVTDRSNAFRRYVHAFVGDGRKRTYYKTSNPLTGSLYKPNRSIIDQFSYLGDLMRVLEEIPVETVAIDDIDELTDIDGVKLDIQGAELDVLRGMEKKLASVTFIECEVEFIELYEGQPLYGDIDAYLRSQGFLLHFMRPPSQRMIKPAMPGPGTANVGSQSAWSDALFTRDFRNWKTLPSDKLWKLALMIHDGYRFFDFTARILHVLDQREGTTNAQIYADRLRHQPDVESD